MENDSEAKQLIPKMYNTSNVINKSDIPFIFNRLYKKTDNKKENGFGLGLSISKRIAEKYNGSIDVYYDENKKTITFIISLQNRLFRKLLPWYILFKSFIFSRTHPGGLFLSYRGRQLPFHPGLNQEDLLKSLWILELFSGSCSAPCQGIF